MSILFVCALFGFCARKFITKPKKTLRTFFSDCTWYIYLYVCKYAVTQALRKTYQYTPSCIKYFSFHVLEWLLNFLTTKKVSPSAQKIRNTKKGFPLNHINKYTCFLILWLDPLNIKLLYYLLPETMEFHRFFWI